MHWALSHAKSALQRLPKARARNKLGTSDEEEEMGESIDEWEEEIAMMHDDNGGGERKDEAAMAPLDKGLILIGAFLSLYTDICFSVLDDIAVDNWIDADRIDDGEENTNGFDPPADDYVDDEDIEPDEPPPELPRVFYDEEAAKNARRVKLLQTKTEMDAIAVERGLKNFEELMFAQMMNDLGISGTNAVGDKIIGFMRRVEEINNIRSWAHEKLPGKYSTIKNKLIAKVKNINNAEDYITGKTNSKVA
jgi:hypothetical protein